MVHHIKWRKYEVMAIAPSSAVTLAGAEQAVRAGIAAAQKSGVEWDEKVLTLLYRIAVAEMEQIGAFPSKSKS